MREKIKKIVNFIKNAWSGSRAGKFGIFLFILSVFLFTRLFCGGHNIQGFIINSWKVHSEQKELIQAKQQLETRRNQIKLLRQNNTSDYIEELGLKVLNFGNPNFQELEY